MARDLRRAVMICMMLALVFIAFIPMMCMSFSLNDVIIELADWKLLRALFCFTMTMAIIGVLIAIFLKKCDHEKESVTVIFVGYCLIALCALATVAGGVAMLIIIDLRTRDYLDLHRNLWNQDGFHDLHFMYPVMCAALVFAFIAMVVALVIGCSVCCPFHYGACEHYGHAPVRHAPRLVTSVPSSVSPCNHGTYNYGSYVGDQTYQTCMRSPGKSTCHFVADRP